MIQVGDTVTTKSGRKWYGRDTFTVKEVKDGRVYAVELDDWLGVCSLRVVSSREQEREELLQAFDTLGKYHVKINCRGNLGTAIINYHSEIMNPAEFINKVLPLPKKLKPEEIAEIKDKIAKLEEQLLLG